MKLHFLTRIWLLGAVVVLLAGCALPESHLPGGFSSTYYRHLRQSSEVITAEATMPDTEPQRKWWSWKW